MLTDIFARRYADYPIWTQYTENESRLLVQCFGVATDVLPYYNSAGEVRLDQKGKWNSIHDRLARELNQNHWLSEGVQAWTACWLRRCSGALRSDDGRTRYIQRYHHNYV